MTALFVFFLQKKREGRDCKVIRMEIMRFVQQVKKVKIMGHVDTIVSIIFW